MKYNSDLWLKRHRHRSDISTYLTHLTKGNDKKDVFDVLLEILQSRKLKGSSTSSGFIIGDNSAVCFQDIPLYGIAQNTLHEQLNRDQLGGKIRYTPIGLCFKKSYIFQNGGRPVLYEQKSVAKKILPSEEWWRIVSFDLSDGKNIVDWTHEREWRIKDDFEFELDQAIITYPSRTSHKTIIEKLGDIYDQLGGIVALDPVLS